MKFSFEVRQCHGHRDTWLLIVPRPGRYLVANNAQAIMMPVLLQVIASSARVCKDFVWGMWRNLELISEIIP